MFSAATRMIRVRIRNITLRSTVSAPNRLEFICCQSMMRAEEPVTRPIGARQAATWLGSVTITSMPCTVFSRPKKSCASFSGMKMKVWSYSDMPMRKVPEMR